MMHKCIRKTALGLAMVAVLLSGCNKKGDENITTLADATKATQAQTESTTQAEATEAPTEHIPVVIERGTVVDKVYVNESLGLRMPIDKIFRTYSDGDIAYNYGYSNKIDRTKGYTKEAIEAANGGVVVDFYGYHSDYKSSIVLSSDNMVISHGEPVGEEAYLDEIKAKLSGSIFPMYVVGDKYTKATIAGREYTLFEATSTSTGEKVTEQYYVRRYDDYMHCIRVIFRYTDRETTQDTMEAILGGITE